MRIVIFGAAGPTGQLLTQQALDRGFAVTAVTRRPREFPLAHGGLRVMGADATDAEQIARAVENTDAVISVVGVKYSRDPITLYSASAETIVAAMRAAGVSRLVVTSSAAVGSWRDPSWTWMERNVVHRIVNALGATLYDDMRRMESIVLASDLDVTIMRPLGLVNVEPPTEYAVAVDHITGKHTARCDLAAAILDEVQGQRADGAPAEQHHGQCVAVVTTNKSFSLPATIWREGIRPQLQRRRAAVLRPGRSRAR